MAPLYERLARTRGSVSAISCHFATTALLIGPDWDRWARLELEERTAPLWTWLHDLKHGDPEVGHLRLVLSAYRVQEVDCLLVAWQCYLDYLRDAGEYAPACFFGRLALHLLPLEAAERAQLWLQVGRCERYLTHWTPALDAFQVVRTIGQALGDPALLLLADIGDGNVHRQRGNIPRALSLFRDVARRAEGRYPAIAGMAWSDVAVTQLDLARWVEGLEAQAEALRRLQDPALRLRCWGDLGIILMGLGRYALARECLEYAREGSDDRIIRANAMVELMHLAMLEGNQLEFRLHARLLGGVMETMPPSMRVDYHFRLAQGQARFGSAERALYYLVLALDIAEAHQLNRWIFALEAAMKELPPPAEPVSTSPEEAERVEVVAAYLREALVG